MNRRKVLSVGVITLLVVNLICIAYLFLNKKPVRKGMRQKGPKEMIIKKLNFDESQKVQFQKAISTHRKKVRKIQDRLQIEKQRFFVSNNDKVSDSISIIIGNLHADLNGIHKSHFKDIKEICKEDQLEAYEELLKNIGRTFGPPRKDHPRGNTRK
jgi:hypothetical protein